MQYFSFVPFVVLVHLHFFDMIYYTAPSLAAYALDKVAGRCSSLRPVRLLGLSRPLPGYTRMVIEVEPGHAFEPGQWVEINYPTMSYWQWHPMSIASSPENDGGGNVLVIDVKALGDWTRDLEREAERFDPNIASRCRIFVRGYFGSSHSGMRGYMNHPAVLMIAGGRVTIVSPNDVSKNRFSFF